MFVGHGLFAFAAVALVGEWRDWDRRLVVGVAVLAGLFATLPDVDIVYAVTGLVGTSGSGAVPVESFWAAGNRVHRGVTHSLVVGVATAAAVWLVSCRSRTRRAAGLLGLGGVVVTAAVVSGPLAAVIAGVFAAGALAIVALADHHGVPPTGVAAAALVGLCTHPFGDLLTGSPPAMLYPFDAVLVSERVTLAADPTLHLLGAFGVELATVWLALLAGYRLAGRAMWPDVDRRAALGAVYGAAALAMPAPTLEVSYHFVFSVLAVGSVAAVPPSSVAGLPSAAVGPPTLSGRQLLRAVPTVLATVTVAAASYGAVYLLL